VAGHPILPGGGSATPRLAKGVVRPPPGKMGLPATIGWFSHHCILSFFLSFLIFLFLDLIFKIKFKKI
jgi:hypothetical protein